MDRESERILNEVQESFLAQFFKKYGVAVANMLRTAGRLISAEDAADRIVEFFKLEFGQRFPDSVLADLHKAFKSSYQVGQNFPVRSGWNKLPVPEDAIDWFARANHFDVSNKMLGMADPIRSAVLEALQSGNTPARMAAMEKALGRALNDPPTRNHLEQVFRNLSNRAQNFSRVKRFESLGIQEVEIVAIMDRRTSAICRTMNGRRVAVQTLSEFVDEFTSTPYGAGFWKNFQNPAESAFAGKLDRLSTADLMKQLKLPLPPYHFRCRTTTVSSAPTVVRNRSGQALRGDLVAPDRKSQSYERYLDWANLKPDERLSKIQTAQQLARWDLEQLDQKSQKHGPELGTKTGGEFSSLSKKVLREFDTFLLYEVDDESADPKRYGFYNAADKILLGMDENYVIRTMFSAKKIGIRDMVQVK
ncbi:MAG: hypothetical protein HS115_11705 [Spirochaetales bacterium]|nr:hypothetical protein [Spirochaetales bacterium]